MAIVKDAIDKNAIDKIGVIGGYAPGKYVIVCNDCKEPVLGADKRARQCLACAIKGTQRRIGDLLKSNNRYQQEARDARAETKRLWVINDALTQALLKSDNEADENVDRLIRGE